MSYEPDIHHRRSIRLRGYDYTGAGNYYITICTEHNRCLLGEVVLGQINENDAGHMVDRVWNSIPARFPTAQLDEHIVMPNHFHGIIKIDRGRESVTRSPSLRTGQAVLPHPALRWVVHLKED
jgi:putative transposase